MKPLERRAVENRPIPQGTIRLRAIEREDLNDLMQWRNELKDNFREYRLINKEHQEAWFKSIQDDRSQMHFAIDVWIGTWLLIGSCNWSHIDWVNRHAQLGIYIGDPDYRGTGAGLKAMIELHRIAFDELHMDSVRLEVFQFNPAVKFYEKFGYKTVGAWRSSIWTGDGYYDSILMDILYHEWEKLYYERYSAMRMAVP